MPQLNDCDFESYDIFNTYDISFRCYFPGDSVCNHLQKLRLVDIPRWLDSYRFTHPSCISVSVKVWFSNFDR